ncbi:MAG: HepT-like ribonuclease domain-containing protein [Armatimonadota bacterium]
MRDDNERLIDILDAIEKIEKYTIDGRNRFDAEDLVQTWVVHHIQVIGESACQISEEMKEKHPDIPWRQIIGMRNILVHAYFNVDPEEIWGVVELDLPILKEKIRTALR